MFSNSYVEFINLCCQFGKIGNSDFFNNWRWKLDPYQKSFDDLKKKEYQLIICKDFEDKANFIQGELLREEPAGFFKRFVHRSSDGGTIWSYVRPNKKKLYLRYAVSPAWDKIVLLEDNTDTAGQLAFEYLGLIFPCVALNYNILTFHGALIEYNGYGVIISAASGVGKTTRARLWRDSKNALIINGDRGSCQKVDGVWTGYGLPWSGTSGEQINRSVPLKALVVLERGEENTVRRMSPQESFGAVLPHLQCPTWDAELVGKAMEQMDDFLQNVPVLHFKSRPDVNAIETLCKFLEEI